MANWAYTAYVLEGPTDILKKIENAILTTKNTEADSSCKWEGDILNTLDIIWEHSKMYMRGFITKPPKWQDNALRFCAEEAWGVTDFGDVLKDTFPNLTVYYYVEESNEEIYTTNDKEGKYFHVRYIVDACVDDVYYYEEFADKDSAYKWMKEHLNCTTDEDVEAFNEKASEECLDDFICIHKVDIIDK